MIQDEAYPAAYNRYSYVYNNPMTLTDPTGRFVVWSVDAFWGTPMSWAPALIWEFGPTNLKLQLSLLLFSPSPNCSPLTGTCFYPSQGGCGFFGCVWNTVSAVPGATVSTINRVQGYAGTIVEAIRLLGRTVNCVDAAFLIVGGAAFAASGLAYGNLPVTAVGVLVFMAGVYEARNNCGIRAVP